MKKDYSVLLIQLGGNLASDVSTRCSGRPQGMKTSYETRQEPLKEDNLSTVDKTS